VPKSGKLLIVDDDAAHTQALSDTLQGQGYEMVRVSSAEAAFAAFRESNFDLVLTMRQRDRQGSDILFRLAPTRSVTRIAAHPRRQTRRERRLQWDSDAIAECCDAASE
jgi:DNA-binding response OmpR family regulator